MHTFLELLDQPGKRLLRALLRQHFVTTPTSYLKRFTGEETWPDALTLAAATTIGGVVPQGVSGNTPVAPAAATTTLTLSPALHAGRVVVLSSTAGLAITPPAATGTGNVYNLAFSATVSGGSVTLDAKAGNASDVFYGWVQTYKATTFTPYITATNSNLMTLDGSTRGGVKGDYFTIVDIATNMWAVFGFFNQTGTIATPFSNH